MVRCQKDTRYEESIAYILERSDAFGAIPSAFATGSAGRYAQKALPMVTQQNALEFCLGAFELWSTQDRHYSSIVRGMQVTYGLICTLRNFASQTELDAPVGELAPRLEEMRVLLARPLFARIPEGDVGSWTFRILRLDQIFRLLEKESIARLLQLVYEIDALVSLAEVTRKYDFVLPDIEEGPLRVRAEGLAHPLVSDAIANPVDLNQNHRMLFLTGPNMAGKTTYLRACATAVYLAHLGMGVPARRFHFVPARWLFSSISLSDELRGGISYFRAEALRVKAVAQALADGGSVISIMDEPFKGTNVLDALDAARAIMERFAARADCLFIFSSHLIELNEQLAHNDRIDCRYFKADESEGHLRFDYVLRSGVSSQRLGMRVLREEGVPEPLDANADDV